MPARFLGIAAGWKPFLGGLVVSAAALFLLGLTADALLVRGVLPMSAI